MTYFMTQKVTVTFVVRLTEFMTPNCHGFIRFRRDLLYDPKGHGDLCGNFDLVYDPKRSFEVNVTYCMTLKVNLTSDLDLDLDHLTRLGTTTVQATL